MSRPRAQNVILCEDRQHLAFVRRYLSGLGYNERQIRDAPCPMGSQAGEQFVRQRYPIEVSEQRRRVARLSVNLVVVIDADDMPVDRRLQQLEQELANLTLPGRGPDERIAILIPRRNIETWIHYLNGDSVNEIDTFPKLVRQRDCQPAVDRLLQIKHSGWVLPADSPASLIAALPELQRLR